MKLLAVNITCTVEHQFGLGLNCQELKFRLVFVLNLVNQNLTQFPVLVARSAAICCRNCKCLECSLKATFRYTEQSACSDQSINCVDRWMSVTGLRLHS
jgi:hypothetical protein